MRKLIVSGAAVCALAAAAQPALAQQNMIGVKGGFVSADLNTSNVEGTFDARTGFAGGAFLQVNVGQSFSIQPEALYVAKGSDVDGNFEVKLSYLEVPILLQYHIPAAVVSPRLFAGPSLAFEMSCDLAQGGVSITCDEGDTQTKSADFGLVFGAGVDVPAGPVVITFDGRYDLGATNIEDSGDPDTSVKNRSWQFFAGLGFPFGP
ncbi:MAG: porin family protein [Gemmatimonadales bacterium]